MSEVLKKTLPLPAGRSSKIETNGSKIESHMELSWKQRDPRWNPRISSAGSKGIQDGIPDGTQTEAKGSEMGSEMESQMELRWSSDGSKGSKGSKGIPDGAQTEAKGFEMESQMELSWKPRNSRLTPTIESK